ncbi:MAG: ParM/StbA family protein [Thermodesulfobacteriota bacterium]|nr:ParM/StbA family protein [Thermodesulfobacteriota bacterium]
MEIIGIDVGFGFTKAYNGTNSVIFKSIMGDATEIQFNPLIGKETSASNLHITMDDKSYFIGNFAELQSSIREFTLDQDKLLSDFVKFLAITAAGVCCDETVPLKVVSGLPVGFLKRDYKKFTKAITGHHKITFHNQNGKDVTKTININKIHIIPQPIGSIFNLIFDDYGKISNRELSMQKLGVVDIGFRTTDFSIFDHLKYIERSSTTMDTGISKCFSVIANKLREESGVNVELYRMFNFIEKGMIKIRGKEYNISNLTKRVFTHAASAIATDLNRLWEDDWDIDSIILSGGGSMALAEYLQTQIQGNIIPIANNTDARLNNVHGYLKFGRYKWGYREPATSPPATSVNDNSDTNDTDKEETEAKAEAENDNQKSSKGLAWLKR